MKKTAPRVMISSSQRALRVPRKRIERLVAFVADREGVRIGEVDLAIVDPREIASVNRRFLQHAGATDVISFDLSDEHTRGLAVQLVICGQVAVAQARASGLKPQHELMLYVIHGLLHMMGYEDHSVRGAAKMYARQDELLREFLESK